MLCDACKELFFHYKKAFVRTQSVLIKHGHYPALKIQESVLARVGRVTRVVLDEVVRIGMQTIDSLGTLKQSHA